MPNNIVLEDDAKESVTLMVEHRLPWLAIGLIGGIIATVIASRFEKLLVANIELSFFIPVIVYMADAVGHQAESVLVRNLGRAKKVHFSVYLLKETALGAFLGVFFGAASASFAYFWFGSTSSAFAIFFAMAITMAISPIVSLTISEILFKEHRDPAIGAGPFATVVQDILSLAIYFFIASLIITGT